MSSDDADQLVIQARSLIQHCSECRSLLAGVAAAIGTGLYDPVDDLYAVRLPGGLVRGMQILLQAGGLS